MRIKQRFLSDEEVRPVDPKDDFHLYANKEWLLENEIPAGYSDWSHYKERDLEVKRQCMELLGDDRLSGHDAGLIQAPVSTLIIAYQPLD